jgi:hypothetical protein
MSYQDTHFSIRNPAFKFEIFVVKNTHSAELSEQLISCTLYFHQFLDSHGFYRRKTLTEQPQLVVPRTGGMNPMRNFVK